MHGPDAAYYRRIARWSSTPKYAGEVARLWRALDVGPRSRVLDLGCGTGAALAWLREAGARAVGVDRGEGWEACGHEQPVARADAALLPFRSELFDGAMLMHVLAHLADPRASLREVARVLRIGGRVGLVTPNAVHLTALKLGPGPVPDHAPDRTVERHYRLGEVIALLEEGGFAMRQASRFGPAPFGVPLDLMRERILIVAEKRG